MAKIMREQLKKALKLARKTNDAIIFFDAETPEDSFAILDLNRYEEMVDPSTLNKQETVYKADLTKEDLADKINREISDWKNQGQSDYLLEESKDKPRWQIPSDIKNKAENNKKEDEAK
jgi:hypothetical protein